MELVGIMELTGISIFTGEFYINQVPTIKLDWNTLQVQDKHKNINMLRSKCAIAIITGYMESNFVSTQVSSIWNWRRKSYCKEMFNKRANLVKTRNP
jgi:hypothetical protein